jgi:hypothetical protein
MGIQQKIQEQLEERLRVLKQVSEGEPDPGKSLR